MLENSRGNSPSRQLIEWLLMCFPGVLSTILLWIVKFIKCPNLYLVPNWLAEVVGGNGWTASASVIVGMMLPGGRIEAKRRWSALSFVEVRVEK